MLVDRGWYPHGNNLWTTEIGGVFYAYNNEKGVLTTQDGWTDEDIALPNLVQRPCDFTTVLSLGFADDWHESGPRLNRERMKLESTYHLS